MILTKKQRTRTAVLTICALIFATFAIPASATTWTAEPAKESTVRVSGTLQKIVIDSAHSAKQDHKTEYLTFLQVDSARIPIEPAGNNLDSLPPGTEVELNIEVPTVAVPDAATGSSNRISAAVAPELAEAIDSPAAATLVKVIAEPTQVSPGTYSHHATVLLPVPSDYMSVAPVDLDKDNVYDVPGINGWGDCELDSNPDCLPPEPADWSKSRGPVSTDRAIELMDGLEDYWVGQTGGRISEIDNTIKRVRVPLTAKDMCDDRNINGLMNNSWGPFIDDLGIDLENQEHLVVLSGPCESGTDGFALIGSEGIASGSFTQVRNDNLPTLIHEFGHMIGLGHSDLLLNNADGSAPYIDYYGLYSPMQFTYPGYDAPALDIAFRKVLGLNVSGEIQEVTQTSTHALTSVTGDGGLKGLEVSDPFSDVTYFVEYRSGSRLDETALFAQRGGFNTRYGLIQFAPGVRVYALQPVPYGPAVLTLGLRSGSGHKTTLAAGQSLSAIPGYRVKVDSISGENAQVTITKYKPASSVSTTNIETIVDKAGSLRATVKGVGTFSGNLTVKIGSKTLFSRNITGKKGLAQVTLSSDAQLPAGTHKVTYAFNGGTYLAPATSTSTIIVKKHKATSSSVKVSTQPYGSARTATFTVASAGNPSGKAVLYVDGKAVATSTVSNKKAVFKLGTKTKVGKRAVSVTLPASSKHEIVTARTTVTVPKITGKITGTPAGTKKVRIGKSYKKKVKVNSTATLQKRVGSKWKTVKTLKKGTRTITFKVSKKTKTTKYRIVLKKTSTVTGKTSKTFTIKPVRK